MKSSLQIGDTLPKRLSESGLRSTPQRKVVYQVLLRQRDHPTAEEIFARVKAELPTISLATVYNCLEALVTCHLVRAVNFERAPTRYCPNLNPHAHFHDEQTGSTRDIPLSPGLLDQLKAILPPGYNASAIEITFLGKTRVMGPFGRAVGCELASQRGATSAPPTPERQTNPLPRPGTAPPKTRHSAA